MCQFFSFSLFQFLLVRLQTITNYYITITKTGFQFLLVRLQTHQPMPLRHGLFICFNSFQLGFRRKRVPEFVELRDVFQFLLVRLQTEQAQSICEWVCVVSIPFSQALDAIFCLFYLRKRQSFNSFQLGFRLYISYRFVYLLYCFNSFQLGFRLDSS